MKVRENIQPMSLLAAGITRTTALHAILLREFHQLAHFRRASHVDGFELTEVGEHPHAFRENGCERCNIFAPTAQFFHCYAMNVTQGQ